MLAFQWYILPASRIGNRSYCMVKIDTVLNTVSLQVELTVALHWCNFIGRVWHVVNVCTLHQKIFMEKGSGLGLPISSCVYIILAQVHVYMMPINQTLLNVIKVEIYMKLQWTCTSTVCIIKDRLKSFPSLYLN